MFYLFLFLPICQLFHLPNFSINQFLYFFLHFHDPEIVPCLATLGIDIFAKDFSAKQNYSKDKLNKLINSLNEYLHLQKRQLSLQKQHVEKIENIVKSFTDFKKVMDKQQLSNVFRLSSDVVEQNKKPGKLFTTATSKDGSEKSTG